MDLRHRIRNTFPSRLARCVPGAGAYGLSAIFASTLLFASQGVSQLPATAPTAAPSQQTTQPPPPPPAQRAIVVYSGGMLAIHASNSSLNQILREVSRETGMKITGGVAEDRVFGDYGPAAPAKVLGSLLDGTASNMLLVEGDGPAPTELVLTPRSGTATPPSPDAFREEPLDRAPDPSSFNRQPPNSVPASQSVPVAPAEEPANAAPAPPTGTSQSPNGVRTPQDIYNQLQRLHQQQSATPQQ